MKRQYLNAATLVNKIALLILLIPFSNMKASFAAEAESNVAAVTEFLSLHISRASLFAGSVVGLYSLVVLARDKRTDEKGNWKLGKEVISDENRWKKLEDNYFISKDTLPYLLDKTLGTLGDYKTATKQNTYNADGDLTGWVETFEETKCFARGSGVYNWLDGNIFRNTPKAAKNAGITVTAFSLVEKAVNAFNPNKKQEKKSE